MNACPSLFDPPEARYAAPAKIERRPRAYQGAIFTAWREQRSRSRGHMLVLATGLGKTFTAGGIAKEETGRVLFVVNRTTLGQQSIASLERDTGKRWQMEQAENWAHINSDTNVVALIQTLMQERRYKRFRQDAFSLVVVDEAHRMQAAKYRAPFEYFQGGGATLLFMTATPAKKNYQPLITNELFNYPLSRAQREAWSVPFDFHPFDVDVDLDRLTFKDGDFAAGELDEAMVSVAAPIAKAAVELCRDLRTLVFCPGVRAVIAAADAINRLRPGSAKPLYGELDNHQGKGTKARTIAEHKAGAFPYLVSCDMVREGYDDEYVRALLIARPMAKLHDFEQIIGRGSRLWPGVGDIEDMEQRRAAIAASPKPTCLVIDLACVSLKHKLVDPVDVLGGDYTEAERARAKKALKKSGGGDPMRALEKAREELERRRLNAEAAAKAKVKLERIDTARLTADGKPALTEGQERKLAEFGIPFDREMTKDRATKLIRFEFLSKKQEWCDYRQRDFLQTWVGVRDARALPVDTGRRLVDTWKARGRMRLTPGQISEIVGRKA